MANIYPLPSHVDESLGKITDMVEEMCKESGDKEGFSAGFHVGMNLSLITLTEMAYERYAPRSFERKAILLVGREILDLMKELS